MSLSHIDCRGMYGSDSRQGPAGEASLHHFKLEYEAGVGRTGLSLNCPFMKWSGMYPLRRSTSGVMQQKTWVVH